MLEVFYIFLFYIFLRLGDTLSFLLYGLNGQNARNLTVSGICCDSAFAVFDNSTGLFTSRVAFFPECISGQSRLNWTIRSPFGLPYPQTVMQLGTNVYQISWTSSSNGNSSTGLVPFSSNPIIGILSSSIAFDVQPLSLSLGISAVYIKVITMMTMNINDAFVFILPQFQSTMTETTVLDSQSNSWTAVWDQSSFTLKLITSRAFSPAFALNLTIPATLSFQLPPLGVAADCDCLLVAMQISGKLLAGQSIQQVQNVGAILALTLQAIAQSPYSSNNDNPLLIRSFTTLHRDVLFRLNMTLSQPLNAGDEIHIYAPSYTFFYNDSLTLQGLDSASFTGECDSRGKRMIFRTETSLSSTVLFSVLPTDAIGVPLLYCNQFNAECPMYVTILSSTCPVNGYPTLADCSYFFPFSFISLRNIEQYYPPSGQPTGQPSSQPSVQPSGQPTARPSSLISFRPTMTPSQLPTLLPTVYPTFLPSIAPSVVPTLPPALLNASSSMPSGQPSSQPTFSPTNNAFPPYLLQIDILYDMQTSLPIKSIIAVFIPQIQSTSNINDTLVLGNQSTYWSSFWNASLQSLELTTLQNLTPGVQSLTILSSNLLLANTLLYENDSSLSYTITSSACFVNGGEFDKVQANGLRSSSLSFTNFTDFNSPIGLHIQFIAEDELLPGDSLVVLLPNFTSSTVGTLLLEAGSDTGARIAWKPSLSGIKIFINTPLMQLNIIVSVLNNITLPLTGSSVLTGLPKISLRTRNIFYYSLTPFLSFKPITVLSFASLSFNSPAIAGQEAIVYIVFNFSPAIVAYDSFSFYLPSLWTSAEGVALLTNTSVGFRLSWSSCSNMLQLTASLGVPGGSFNLSILGLRLPVDGLGLDLSQIFTVSSNASNGMILPTPFNTVQLVGFFLESNLSILNPALSGSPVSFQLVFRASFSLKPNESVMVLIPGVTATDPLLSFGLNTSGFTVTWDAVASTVVFTSLFPIEANTSITISCNSSLILPLEGFPPPNSSTLISSDASEGPVDPSNLSHVDAVGLEASVHYLIDDLKDYVGIRFEILTFSFFIGLGDTIVITTPLVSGVASSSSNVSAFGSFAENGFAPIFDVTFDPILSNFILVATQSISSHRMNVFVSRSNQFILNLATAGIVSQHQVRGTFASLGVMSKRDINFTPLSLRNYSNNAVTASFLACNYVDSCSLLMNLQLGNGLIAGESILIGHASFMFPSLSSGAANLTITGIDSELFDVSIRTADNIEAISIDPSMQYNGGAPIATTLADVSYHPFNSTLPETVLPVSVYTTLPRIYGSIMETNLVSLSCGDSIAITLLFTQQVQVYQPSGLLLQLNTQESAYYLNGSGSMALSFIYRVSSPLEVAFLSTNGANALLLTQGANITNAFQSNMAANTTLPFPFAIMNSVTGQPALMGVNCSSSISTILSVEVYGIPSTSVLATGDVLNVAVQFNRAITVVGVPSLLLSGDFNATYIAVYRNVSLIQLLDVVGPGMYTLGYEDENTYCIAWNDTLGLAAALQTLPSLQDALPVVITSFVTTGALRYRLEFTGQPPFVLTASRVLCDVTATARVSLDPNMLSVAVFSYTVLSGDAAAHVSYPNSSSLLLDTVNRIYLGDIIRQTPVVGLLPIPGAVNSLFATSNISIRTQSPLVVNVFSNFSSSLNLSYAITGDIIPIYIRFSNAITVIGNPSLLLNVSSLLKPVNSYTPQAEFVTAVDDVLVLQYIVMSGDLAFPLKVLNNASLLLLNGSEILLRSLHPQTLANITLPAPVSTNSLFNSSIFVNASGASSLLSISCDQPPGLYGAGVTLILNLNLFSPVNLLSSNLSSPLSNTPSIILAAPFEAVIQYINGSGTSSLAFSFLIQFGDNANHILFSPVGFSFSIQLLNGYFSDNLGNIWNEFLIPPRYDYLDGVVVDTSPPFVLFVNTSNSNGTYFPGELIDIIVVFSKPVAVTGVPQIELFVPYEDIPQKLATYSFGSGSYELHFLFLVPPADSHFSFHPDVPLVICLHLLICIALVLWLVLYSTGLC